MRLELAFANERSIGSVDLPARKGPRPEPHYLASFGLMPAGAVVVYTPRDEQELEVCYFPFSESTVLRAVLFAGKGKLGELSPKYEILTSADQFLWVKRLPINSSGGTRSLSCAS